MKTATELMDAAYAHTALMKARADGEMRGGAPVWHGWALREAFPAGASRPNPGKPTAAPVEPPPPQP